VNHRESEARRTRTKEQPSLIKDWNVSVLLNGQKGFGVEEDQLTSMKSQKTGPVSKGCTEAGPRTHSTFFFPSRRT